MGELNWGSVPDWFAAIGTVGALFLGLVLLTQDRRRSRRADADAFAVWVVQTVKVGSDNGTERSLIVHAHNAGSMPIQVALIRSPSHELGYTLEFLKNRNGHIEMIDPGETIVKTIEYGDQHPNLKHLVVQFVDGKGRSWYRLVESRRYISPFRHWIMNRRKANGDPRPYSVAG